MNEITFTSKEFITPGSCLNCHFHFINLEPVPGEPATGCILSGEFLPDDWDTEDKLWDKCPVIQCIEKNNSILDKFKNLVRRLRYTAKTLDILLSEPASISTEKEHDLMRFSIKRKDGTVEVLLLPHKDGSGYSFVNLTKRHICSCKFATVEDAIKDMKSRDNVLSYQVET